MLKQVSNYFGDVLQFLEENENLSHGTRRNLLDIFENPQDLQDLLLKLAAVVDASQHTALKVTDPWYFHAVNIFQLLLKQLG